jgi:putative phosphotransacetylase
MLFGDEAHLTPLRSLVQPDQFVSIHEVILEGPKGSIPRVKILGPFRKQTQVEISITDARRLGVPPVIRLSGDLAGTPGCTLRGPCGTILLDEGVIVAARHLHLSTDDAACYKLRSGQVVQVATTGQRAAILDGIIVRVGDDQALELHLDCDEVNAAGIRGGDLLELRPSP